MKNKRKIKTGIIGVGYWGPNYARIFNELDNCEFCCCSDLDQNNLDKITRLYPKVQTTKNYKEMIKNSEIEAVVIVTPLDTHYEIAKFCLQNKKNILIEKPFTADSKQGEELLKIAENNRLTLMVGHVYEFNPGIVKLKEIIQSGKLGEVYYINAERLGLGPIRKHANALWDLATHDISIALYLLGCFPEKVTAIGGTYLQKNLEDMVFLSLKFPNGVLYNIFASWIAPEKIRKTTVVGSESMAVFDDVAKSETLKIYERKLDRNLLNSTAKYRDHQSIISIGGVWSPKIEESEPLKNQVRYFFECILNNKKPIANAQNGLAVIEILEAAEKSLKFTKGVKCR